MLRHTRLLIILAFLPVFAFAKDSPSDYNEPVQLELWPELKNSLKISPNGFEFQDQVKIAPPPEVDTQGVTELKRHSIVIIDDAPAAKPVVAESSVLHISTHGQVFVVGSSIESSAFQDYLEMTEDYKRRFQVNRVIYLTQAARLLNTAFLGNLIGSGSVVASQTSWAWDTFKHYANFAAATPSNFNSQADLAMAMDIQRSRESSYGDAPAVVKKVYSERRAEVIQNILNGIDRSFWEKPYLTANSNEFSAYASVGPTLFAGYEKKAKTVDGETIPGKKWGVGGSFDLGIMLGWNKESGSAVIQVFRLTEKFRGTMTAFTANAAVVPKVGFMVANVDMANKTKAESGKVLNPPMPPGIPAYFLSGSRRFGMGANLTIGAIPYPFDSILVYSMDYVLKPMLRLNFRFEVFRDFISVDKGPKGEAKSFVKSKVGRSVARVRSMVSGKKMCVAAHSQ